MRGYWRQCIRDYLGKLRDSNAGSLKKCFEHFELDGDDETSISRICDSMVQHMPIRILITELDEFDRSVSEYLRWVKGEIDKTLKR